LPAPYFEFIEREADKIKMHFMAEAGLSHRVEFNDTLSSGGWQTLTNIDAIPVTTFVEVSDDAGNAPQRFYRLNAFFPSRQSTQAAGSDSTRIILRFNARPGKPYTVEYKNSSEATDWRVLIRINPLQEAAPITVCDPDPGESSRFYRLRSP